MLFKKMAEIVNTIKANTYFNNLNQNIYDAIEANEIFEDFKKVEYTPTESTSQFLIPDNYTDSSYVEVYIDGVETTDYTIIFQNFAYLVAFSEDKVDKTIVIKVKNFKKNFVNAISKNMPIG